MNNSLMNSDMEFYAKRMRTELTRQQSDSQQIFVPVSVFEEIIIHLSRRLDSFEERLYSLESSKVLSDDMLRLIREEYKQFTSILNTSTADTKTQIEITARQIKQLEKATNSNTNYLNEISNSIVSREEFDRISNSINEQLDQLNGELTNYVNSSNKNNQFMVLKTKEIELVLDSIKSQSVSKDQSAMNIITQVKGQSEQTVQQLQGSIEREFEWIKANLIKVIDLVIQQGATIQQK